MPSPFDKLNSIGGMFQQTQQQQEAPYQSADQAVIDAQTAHPVGEAKAGGACPACGQKKKSSNPLDPTDLQDGVDGDASGGIGSVIA